MEDVPNASPLALLCLQAAFTGKYLPLKAFAFCFEAPFGGYCLRFTKGGQGAAIGWCDWRGRHGRQQQCGRPPVPPDA